MFTVRTDHFLNSLIARPLLLGNVSLVSLRPTTITMVDEKIKADGNWASRPYVGISSPQNRPIPLDFSRKFTNNSSFKKQGNFKKIIPAPNILSGSNHFERTATKAGFGQPLLVGLGWVGVAQQHPTSAQKRANRAAITFQEHTEQYPAKQHPTSSSNHPSSAHRQTPYELTK